MDGVKQVLPKIFRADASGDAEFNSLQAHYKYGIKDAENDEY